MIFPIFRILSRLTYALCLNFLSVIHLDSHITGVLKVEDTAFTSVSYLCQYLTNTCFIQNK